MDQVELDVRIADEVLLALTLIIWLVRNLIGRA